MPEGDSPERRSMEQALALAALAEGTTSPNPRVGCVVVRDGRPVGWGFHEAVGDSHAEARAVSMAGERARGSTLFVNLEPCAHHGRTPPCTDLLIRAGVRRVVASLTDPNPLVNGRGFRSLREAGVEVEVGLLAAEAGRLNERFLHWHSTGRPIVTLKAAVSIDGMLAGQGGSSRWITGEMARRFAHRLRLRHDAVLVGAGTVRRDDPRLDVRLEGVSAPRVRAVLAPGLDIRPDAAMLSPVIACPPPRVYVSSELPVGAESSLAGRAEVVRVRSGPDGLDLVEVLADLARLGVQSLLVEGGARTFAGFLAAALADRTALFVAPRLLGARGGTPLLDLPAVEEPSRGWRIEGARHLRVGEDLLVLGSLAYPARGNG